MDSSTEEKPQFTGYELGDRFEYPSSNERNTNTLCSSSESDVMKTPSAGGDSPGVFSPELTPAVEAVRLSETPQTAGSRYLSAGSDSPGVFSPEPALTVEVARLGEAAGAAAEPRHPPAGGDARPAAADVRVPTPAAPAVNGTGAVSPSPSAAPVSSGTAANVEQSPAAAASPRPAAGRDAISASPHRAAECCCLLCDVTFHPRLGEGLRSRAGRGRAARTTYHSQISPEANSIKLKIRVETLGPQAAGSRRRRKDAVDDDHHDAKPKVKRRRRSKKTCSDDDERPLVRRRRSKSTCQTAVEDDDRPQGPWGERASPELLCLIFSHAVSGSGAVPTLVRLSRVCRLWRQAALTPSLWHTVDLATGRIPDKFRHERLLLWLIENRLSKTEELNLAGWSNAVVPATVAALCDGCPQLRRLSLSGCRRLAVDEVVKLAELAPRLDTLDLSDLQPHSATARSPVGLHCLQEVARLTSHRLVSLTLAHNCVTGIQQIVNSIAEHCPNLEVLDLSNIMNAIRDIVPLRVERLQSGCPRLRILRWTNTELKLADTTLKEQMSAQGFPDLEELSVAVPKGRHWGLDDAGVERVLKTSHKLRLLDVRGCARLSDSSLVRVPAWNLQHLFLSGCEVTRTMADRLELIVRKWRHSLLELDLSWASNQPALDAALNAMAEPDSEQPPPPLTKLDLCGAAGNFEPVCRLVTACPHLAELNLTSCRALPRGVKRLYRGDELARLRRDIAAGRYRDGAGGDT